MRANVLNIISTYSLVFALLSRVYHHLTNIQSYATLQSHPFWLVFKPKGG